MKRNLHFYVWLAAVMMMMCSTTTMSAQTKVTSLDQLKAGSVIKIYPKNPHYSGEGPIGLSCEGNGEPLGTSYALGSGSRWTLVDAGDGYYYLRNDLGCYWAYQGSSSTTSLTCTTSLNSAVKVSLTWNSKYSGVCFWNKQDGKGLNNLNGKTYDFNWWSSLYNYNEDSNTTFDVVITGAQDFQDKGIRYLLYVDSKTAEVIRTGDEYRGDIVIPQSLAYDGNDYVVTSLGSACFHDCLDLTSITLPNNVTSFGKSCFRGCSGLTSITLPNNVTSLGERCFMGCSGLTSITLPNNVTSLGEECFRDCSGLTSITLPNSITILPSYCFWDCSGLTSITLPNNVTSLDKGCFAGCSGLTSITLPNSITYLGERCFMYCSGLTSITLPNSITYLNLYCFEGCSGMKELTLPASLDQVYQGTLDVFDNNVVISCLAPNPPSGYRNFIKSNYRIFVPSESLEKYKSTYPWYNAHSINPIYPVKSVVLPTKVSVLRTNTTKVNYSVLPENAGTKGLAWSSENYDVVSVDADGVITGKKIGTAKIVAKATDGTDVSASTIVTVLPQPVETIMFSVQKLSITKTKSATVSITVNPVDADNKNATWTSSDENIATITPSTDATKPLEAIVTAKKVGKTTIKAEAQDGSGVAATCEVEVTPLMVSDISAQTTSVVKTIPTKMEMEITPTEADNQKLKWSSLTPEIATVTEEGVVTGQKMGTATLKAETTDGSNISKTFEVQVTGLPVSTISMPKETSIIKTEKQKLEYSILPLESDNQQLKWSSDAPTIASVDETSGVITANKVGDAVITAMATDGSGMSASTTIHVTPLKVSHINVTEALSLLRSMTGQVEATIEPELADNKTLEWTSDDENIATVTQEGVVKGVNVGSANITATTTDGSNLSATCKVTVSPVTIDLSTKTINLRKGDSYAEQMVNVLPENYEHRDVNWSSTDNGVASVNANGVITAVKPGITTIKYALDYDNNITSECKVIVYDDNVVYVGGIYYILDKESKEATVTSIYGGKNTSLDAKNVAQYYSGTINIPETIIYDGDKYTVKYVGSYAFNCQNELQSIIVPRTVTAIRDNAAIKAENLNRVNVANESQLVSIGKQAFMECTGLKRFTFDGTSLSMNLIDKEAFKNCTALERVAWMDDTSIKTIGYGAFYGCSALEKVQWMKKSELQTIQDYAFFRCVSLNNFEMPNTTLSVGNSSFRYNSSLTNIHLSTSLNYIDEYAFGECGFSQITLPESLANIQAGAFINNEHLQEITLPEKLQGLGSAAFENNSALESVTFKTAIETMTIGSNAFNLCPILNKVYITNLNSFAQTNFNNAKANPANTSQHIYDANGKEIINVVLPKGTKYVNNNAFNGCAYIESIEMPETMDHVNDDIFYGCSALKDVFCYAEDVPDFIGVNDPSSMDAVFKQAALHVPFGSEAKYQKDTEWWGRFGSIQGCDPQPTQVVEKIDLSTRTVNLKAGTTYNDQKITVTPAEAANVRIKYSTADRNVADIDEDGVIHGVAAGVTTITYTANDGSGVTAECKVIVREPEVEYVGDLYYLFDKGKKQATVTSIYGGKNTSLDAEKVAQYYTGTVNIPEQTTFDAVTYDVKAIGGYAFTCQNDLQALRVGAFVEEIADNAATKAQNLNRITVANASQLKNIGKEAFMDCAGLQHVLFEGTTQSMEAINMAAFKNCTALQDVIWEGKSTLNLIGNSAFYGCSKLETVKWNDLCSLQVIDDYAFYQCSSLNHFMMPNSTLSVGKYSFRYDAALTDISLSTSLSIIYDYAFGECGFTQIVLPESLKSLQAGAFINNSYLADITIPKKLEGIGAGAFENNDALETVTFKTHETKLTVDKNAFNYCPALSRVNIDYLDDWAHINFQNAAANPASTAHRLYLNNEEILDVNLPVGTKYIGNNVFNGCSSIRTLTVPATVEHINDNIIYGCSALRDVYCYAAKVPQFIGTEDASAMSDVFSQATLHVIYGNEAAYKADSWWGRFYKVEGCNAPSDTDVKVSSITISQTEATLKPDDTMQLEATVYPTNATNQKIIWKSSNEEVAQVTEDGFVLAIAEGEADITAEAADGSGIEATCKITVKEPEVKLTDISFDNTAMTIVRGTSVVLDVNFYPENATNKQLVWTSTRPAVATVDENGEVTALTEGKTIITAKTTDGSNLTITCVVTVTEPTGIGTITVEDVKIIIDKRHLKVVGLADNDMVQIVNTIGFTVYKGTEHEIDLGASGVYIIKVKGKMLKFSVK